MHYLKVAKTDANVLILGETNGKELVARSLHSNSAGARGIYQRRHGSISESLFESELFAMLRAPLPMLHRTAPSF